MASGFPYPLACREYQDISPYPIVCENLRDIVDKVCPPSAPESPAGSGQCTGGVAKQCPTGYVPDRVSGRCIKTSTPTCPAGSTYYEGVAKNERNRYPVCIPDSVQLPDLNPTATPGEWPCGPGVLFGALNPVTKKAKCVPSPSEGTPTPSSGTTTSTPSSSPAPVTTTLEEVNQSLKPFRPPTSPGSDKAIERKAILSGNRSLVFVQLALFILLAVLVVYVALPLTYANGIAFVLVCVGVAYGFFLRR